jgi:hypothetical protein
MGDTTAADHVQQPWSTVWLWGWGVVAVALIVSIQFVAFKWWAFATLVGFGAMEGVGLLRPHDPYPPLTQVIREYVPRWVAFSLIYGIVGGAGATWFKVRHPLRVALLVGLLGWFTAHFDVTFDDGAATEERVKYQRLARLVAKRGARPSA